MGRTRYIFSFLPSPFLLSEPFEQPFEGSQILLKSQGLTNQLLPGLGQIWVSSMKWVGSYMIMVNPTSAWSLGTPSTIGLVAAQRLNRSKGQKGAENLTPARNWIFMAQTEE